MDVPTLIGALIIFGIFAAIVIHGIRKHKAGKGGCGCGCSHCANSSLCHPDKH